MFFNLLINSQFKTEKSMVASNSQSITEQNVTKALDNLFKGVGYKSDTSSFDDLRKEELAKLDNSGMTFFLLGDKARVMFWKVEIDRYDRRDFLFGTEELRGYIQHFAKYLQKHYGIPKSSAAADVKVIKMLVSGDRRKVLEKPIKMLNSYLRLFSSADEKWKGQLVDDVETFTKHAIDELKSCFKVIKSRDEKWHLRLLGDVGSVVSIFKRIVEEDKELKVQQMEDKAKLEVGKLIEKYEASDGQKSDAA
jgi:hypothetical protein